MGFPCFHNPFLMILGGIGIHLHDFCCPGDQLEIWFIFMATLGQAQLLRPAGWVVTGRSLGALINHSGILDTDSKGLETERGRWRSWVWAGSTSDSWYTLLEVGLASKGGGWRGGHLRNQGGKRKPIQNLFRCCASVATRKTISEFRVESNTRWHLHACIRLFIFGATWPVSVFVSQVHL